MPYIINPGSDLADGYMKEWIKWPSNLPALLGSGGGWYTFAEWKTNSTLTTGENYDYRIAIYIYIDNSGTPQALERQVSHLNEKYLTLAVRSKTTS